MSDAQEAIIANAAYHSRLLTAIGQLEYVPSAKKHQINYIEDLQSQLAMIQKEVAQLAEKTKKERKEHEALRDSTGRRLAHKLMGKREKYEAKASKEEREYVEALEREMIARNNQAVVQQLLNDGRSELMNLTEKEEQFLSAKAELTDLYGRVFNGPTECFPEDDRLENEFYAAQRRCDKIRAALDSESRATLILTKAVRYMDACQSSMQEAVGYSRYDMWGGGSMADIIERNALVNAQTNASQVEMLVSQAIRASPRVQPIGPVDIAQGSIISDAFFGSIFNDMAFHNKIKQLAAQVILSSQRLEAERVGARRRLDAARGQLVEASETLDRCHQEMSDFRRATFESYVAQNPPPPSYDVVTMDEQSAAPTNNAPPAEEQTFPITRSPPPDPFIPGSSSSPSVPQAPMWGSRNPYAAAMTETGDVD